MTTERRSLGFFAATALVVGNMIGSGTYLLPATLAEYGKTSLWGWSIAFFGAMATAVVFARLARVMPHSGGPYAHARGAFGRVPGYIVAWSYWVSIWVGNAAIAIAFAAAFGALFPGIARINGGSTATALFALLLVTAINLRGQKSAGRLQVVTTLVKILPLAVFAAVGIGRMLRGTAIAMPAPAPSPGVVDHIGALVLWAFLGLESATVPAESVKDAERTVPRATLAGTALAGVISVLATFAIQTIVAAPVLKDSTAPFADAARAVFGESAAVLCALAAAISAFGALNGWVLLAGEVPYAAARDGVFFRAFERLDRNGTPRFGIIVSGILAAALILMQSRAGLVELFSFAILLSTSASLLPYAVSALALLKLGKGVAAKAAAVTAFLFGIWALRGAGVEALSWGGALIAAGLVLYVARGGGHRPPAPPSR